MLELTILILKKEEISEKREEELRGAIDLHGEDSSRDENMLKSILDLDEITVGSIMVPRKDIFSLPVKISYNDLLEKIEDSPHSKNSNLGKKILKILSGFFM